MVVSPLEYEPELISGIGLITVRWAMLEHELAYLLGEFAKAENIGRAMYYALGSFSARLDLVTSAAQSGLVYPKHKAIVDSSQPKINRLWKKRNKLIHSHYGYALDRGNPPGSLQTAGPPHRDGRIEIPGYLELQKEGIWSNFIPVNKGTFTNHADQVALWTLRTRLFANAIRRKRVRLMPPAARASAK